MSRRDEVRGLPMLRWAALLCATTLCATAACTLAPAKRGPAPSGYAERPSPHDGELFPNWPAPPHRVEELILHHQHLVEEISGAGAGTTGAEKVTLAFPDENVTLDLKWKWMPGRWSPVSGRLDGINNSPRKELAAWKLQRLFLDPEDYVVPETIAYCVPIERARHHHPDIEPTLQGTQCALGVAAVWLQDLQLADPLLDAERFHRDYVYAYHLANLNLFTYVVKHHDGRKGNFLMSRQEGRPQFFAIDNGVSFGGIFYNWFVANWNSIRVPALRADAIERLRKLRREDVEQTLGVVAQLELNDAGVYVNARTAPNLDTKRGVRIVGRTLQLGLTDREIDDTWQRIQELIEDVDTRRVPVF